MARYLLSPRAQADIDGIWDYSVDRWGEERAESYVRGLWLGDHDCCWRSPPRPSVR